MYGKPAWQRDDMFFFVPSASVPSLLWLMGLEKGEIRGGAEGGQLFTTRGPMQY